MAQPLIKKCVLLIHGINPDHTWPERMKAALEPHFRCVPLPYSDYTRWGISKLVVGPLTFLGLVGALTQLAILAMAGSANSLGVWGPTAAFLVLALCVPRRLLHRGLSLCRTPLLLPGGWPLLAGALGAQLLFVIVGWYAWTLPAALLTVSVPGFPYVFRVPGSRRDRVHREFLARWGKLISAGERPHVIAHSLGTVLTAEILEKYPYVYIDRLVLVGSILYRDFPFQEVLAKRPEAFMDVRNEVANWDYVVWFAGLAGYWISRLGFGGLKGFQGPDTFVHTVGAAAQPCSTCTLGSTAGKIHNVVIGEYLHSDAFITAKHAEMFWLPYLWGYSVMQYRLFREWCLYAAQNRALKKKLAYAEEKLAGWTWDWSDVPGSKPMSLESCLRTEISACVSGHLTPEEVQDLVDSAIGHVWRLVAEGIEKSKQGEVNEDKALLALNPQYAAQFAIEAVT